MDRLTLTAGAFCLLISVAQPQGFTILTENRRINVTEGGNAFFSLKPSAEARSGSWAFKDTDVVVWIGATVDFKNNYGERAEFFPPNGSLLLKSVRVSDSGDYSVTMSPPGDGGSDASAVLTLHVLESISKPIISSNNANPVEHNDVTLTCTASGPVDSYYWLKGDKIINPGGRIVLGGDNTTLTISGVLRPDGGFTCYAYNAIDGRRSDPYYLNVSYGPESLTISINPQSDFYILGADVIFSCSAVSKPIPEFQWYLNGNSLQQNGQQLIISDISLNNNGNYTCEAFNNATKGYSMATTDILVVEPVSKPTITSNDTNPIEYIDTVALTCHASGTAVSYRWHMENKTINSSDRIGLSNDNSTLTISEVLRSDDEFTCYGYNMINENASDPYLLNVNYGPESLNISKDPQLTFHLGSNVNFSCSAVSNPASEFQWYLNGNSLQQNGHQLIIADISLNDTGNYTCEAYNNATKRYSLITTDVIVVVEPVSKPNVTANVTNPVELNDTVVLTCFASGTAISYQWLQDNSAINPGDRFDLSADNSSLTISGILRSDGEFTCNAYNSINAMTSDPYHLNISYGPDSPNVSVTPDLSAYLIGRTVTFSCSADSNPPAELEWNLNNTSLQQKGQRLIIDSITLNSTGNYTCQAFNNLTKRYSASTKQIVVIEPVSIVTVSSNNSKPIENIDTILLTCNASGFIQSRIWCKDTQVIKEDDRVITSPDNATLTIISVNRNNSGTYRCNASNDFSSNFGDTNLQINYGPEKVIITPQGPIQVELGKTRTLHCAAQSVPPATYEWYNGSRLLKTGQTYNIESISLNADGSYTCRANNNITNKSKNTTIQVTVQAVSSSVKKLSVGGIVAIVIAVLFVVALIIGITAWMFKKKICRAKCGSQHNNIKMASRGNEPVSYSNGTNTQTTKPKDIDVVYAQPYILPQGPNASTASTEINKTDYAELKFK